MDVPVVKDFLDVFPEDLPGVLPDKQLEFTINLISRVGIISKTLYRMAPIELQELKLQMQELLDKSFIWPSVSPWGCSSALCKQEKWIDEDMHRLLEVKSFDHKK